MTPESSGVEVFVQQAVLWLRLAIETTGAAMVAIGFAIAVIRTALNSFVGREIAQEQRRVGVARAPGPE